MYKMPILVDVDYVNEAKEGANSAGYADLLFNGGRMNLPLNKEHYEILKRNEGGSLNCIFKMRVCETIDRYKNRKVAFEPVGIFEIEKE